MSAGSPFRQLYEWSADPQACPDAAVLLSLAGLGAQDTEGPDLPPPEALARLADWASERRLAFSALWDRAWTDAQRRRLLQAVAIHTAPLGLRLGCWLQGMSAPGVVEDETQLALLTLLADDVGAGRPGAGRSAEFRRLLERLHLALPGDSTRLVLGSMDVHDRLYRLPALLLGMSRRSEHFGLELAGADLVLRTVGLLPAWHAAAERYPSWLDWQRLHLGRPCEASQLVDPLVHAQAVVRHCRRLPAAGARLDRAIGWTIQALREWDADLMTLCSASLEHGFAMAELLRRRAREASVHHHEAQLAGCPMANYFQLAAREPQPLMQVLAHSRYVRPGHAQASSLATRLVGAKGPMFRVFARDELETIRDWIDHLPTPGSRALGPPGLGPAGTTPVLAATAFPARDADAGAPRDLGHAFHLLQGRALPAGLRRWSVRYVERWLAATPLRRVPGALPPRWPGPGLGPWLHEQHQQRSIEDDEARLFPPPSRDIVVQRTVRLAPLMLIDGAWLQGFSDVELALSDVGHLLFRTYWDELGNGQLDQNHARLFRDLLAAMGVELPPTASAAFVRDPRFAPTDFRLPVLWLCIGKSPQRFLPEILGLNLAVELSGVGASHRQARRALVAHGFPTRFVDLHGTIDNITTGHSAWAAEAIGRFMESVLAYGDPAFAQRQWARVRRGHAALRARPPLIWLQGLGWPFARSAPDRWPAPLAHLSVPAPAATEGPAADRT